MKICLINPPTTAPDQEAYLPMALLALGGALKQAGIACRVVDFDHLYRQGNCGDVESFLPHAVEILKQTQCDVFGITTICSNFPMAVLIAEELKKHLPCCRIIMGGPQVSSVPTETLEAFSQVDCVVVGEGEQVLTRLLSGDYSGEHLASVPGICFRANHGIKRNAPQPLINNLDDLPQPDYSLIDIHSYSATREKGENQFSMSVEAGRGCPFHCTFCSTKHMWEQTFRVKSPERILSEMEYLHHVYGFKHFGFIHDNFTTQRKFVFEFADYMIGHNRLGLTWASSSRTDCIDAERLERLYQAGCRGLFFGVETASKKMQKVIHKNLKLDRFEPLIVWMNRHRLNATTAFITGFPEETEDDLNATVLTAHKYKKLGACNVQFSQLAALGGTELLAKQEQYLYVHPEESSMARDRLRIHRDRVDKLIIGHKRLFSAFYTVPTPHLPPLSLEGMGIFFGELINKRLALLTLIFEKFGERPIDLFKKWHEWVSQRNTSAKWYGGFHFLHLFPLFAHEQYFRQALLKLQFPPPFMMSERSGLAIIGKQISQPEI
ncbi:MAG: radical SAM protein [Deltaproteobacteria bacterium]|nr:radical SAM protein [Deltaproteobacteria bacterium]